MKKILLALLFLVSLVGCSSEQDFQEIQNQLLADRNYVKERARNVWESHGFELAAYQGHQYNCLWYTLRKIPDNGLTYQGCLRKQDNEIFVYDLSAIDAVRPVKAN